MIDFNDIIWHDSILLDIQINREKSGIDDNVKLEILLNKIKRTIIFYNCYGIDFKMNFGIIAEESILQGYIDYESNELKLLKEKWIKLNIDLEKIKCFIIETNSTNSIIKIYAEYCLLES